MSAFGSLFSGRYLTSDPNGFPGVFYDIYTGLLVVLLLAAIYVYLRRRPLSRGVTPRRHLLRAVASWTMWFTGIGLLLALFRYLQVQYLDMRLLTYLLLLAVIAYCGYLTYYLSEHYPTAVARFKEGQLDKRYRVSPTRKPALATAAPGRRPALQRGKRKR